MNNKEYGGSAAVSVQLTATDTEIAKIPKSDSTVSWNATALQAIQDEAEDALEGENLDHLLKLDGATNKYPEQCANDSIIAKIIAKGDPATPSSYDNSTDSLEAISDAIGALNDISTANVNTEVDNALNTIVPASPTAGSVNDILSKAAGGNTFDKSTDSLEAIRDAMDSLNNISTANVNTEVDNALNTIVPASPTAGSLNDILSKAAGGNTFSKTTDSLEMLSDKIGGFSGDGGAAADDSVKALLDIINTAVTTTLDGIVDNILLDTAIKVAASGSKTFGTGVTKYLSIDSGTNGADILAIVTKGVVGADWTLNVYIPAEDAVADTAAGDLRDSIAYVNTDTEGGLLAPFAIPFNCFLDFTNDSGGDDNIDQVRIVYRSRGSLTVEWET